MPTVFHEEHLGSRLHRMHADLRATIRETGSALVAFSGGVDSALVAFVAGSELGDQCLAVTAESPAVPRAQLEEARAFVVGAGIRHEVIDTRELEDPGYRTNARDRCFFCKTELYSRMSEMARERGLAVVLDGTNLDDTGDIRPGIAAAKQQGVRSPLCELGFRKRDVRELSRLLGLSTWNKPAAACLSSRVAYGHEVTPELLARIEAGETALRELGFRQLRVRHHGVQVRIEIDPAELDRALEPAMAARFVEIFKGLGYDFVTLDLEGYRSGSLNAG